MTVAMAIYNVLNRFLFALGLDMAIALDIAMAMAMNKA